ncbi:unnamed protein product [Linum trigynum]|uniref:Uncharacterized protein n=1 Tax=Linum trigynum TaxID=586398 RepID=A0AAV2DQA6_9ROSI
MVKFLEIDGKPFDVGSQNSFKKRVAETLKRRSDSDGLDISFEFSAYTDRAIFDDLLECAAAYKLQHLWVRGFTEHTLYFGEPGLVFKSIITHCGPSLENLELEDFKFDGALVFGNSCSGFKALTALSLSNCFLDFTDYTLLNPFTYFPALKQLRLSDFGRDESNCEDTETPRCLEIKGDQLLTLELNRLSGFDEIEVSAASLNLFTYRGDLLATELSLNLTSLETADIVLKSLDEDDDAEKKLKNLFNGLSHAKSLDLAVDATKPLWDACKLVQDQRSPFRRLESLALRLMIEENITVIPQYVKGYFFGDSPPKPKNVWTEVKMKKP